jgi:uncharacterized membrane protein
MQNLVTSKAYKIISKPNSSLNSTARVKIFLLLAIIPILVGIGFTIIGLWVIFPFVGLELLALGCGFYYFTKHAGDFESISIEGDKLVVEKHNKSQTTQFEFNAYWAKLILNNAPNGNLHIFLRNRGKDLEIGCFMNDDQRHALAEQLKKHLNFTYQQ